MKYCRGGIEYYTSMLGWRISGVEKKRGLFLWIAVGRGVKLLNICEANTYHVRMAPVQGVRLKAGKSSCQAPDLICPCSPI